MYATDKKSETVKNGRKLRGFSPNGHTSDLSYDEEGAKIRVGRDYQAIVSNSVSIPGKRLELFPDHAILMWSPTSDIPDFMLNEYMSLAKEKYGYNGEQALGMLFWHKHNLNGAISDLPNFKPYLDEWTVEDKVMFELAFQLHGKNFHWIKQMLPDKSIGNLVRYYYTWKKTRDRTSLMDRQVGKLDIDRDDTSDSDSVDKKSVIYRNIRHKNTPPRQTSDGKNGAEGGKKSCTSCRIACIRTYVTPKGNMCSTCYRYWRRTGSFRPMTGYVKRKPPRDMHINYEDLVSMAASSVASNPGDQMLKTIDRDLVSLLRLVQNNKQNLSALKKMTSEGLNREFCMPETSSKINARWTTDELLLAVQGVRKYGKDFRAIAEVLGTKTEDHVLSFFYKYRRRYNLDAVLKEFEAENLPAACVGKKPENMSGNSEINSKTSIDNCLTSECRTGYNKH